MGQSTLKKLRKLGFGRERTGPWVDLPMASVSKDSLRLNLVAQNLYGFKNGQSIDLLLDEDNGLLFFDTRNGGDMQLRRDCNAASQSLRAPVSDLLNHFPSARGWRYEVRPPREQPIGLPWIALRAPVEPTLARKLKNGNGRAAKR